MTDSVVCARGERAATFVPVIRALRKGAGGQVIFVDDGQNRGVWRARLAGALVVDGPQAGKAAAMRAGLARVHTSRVIFADADLSGFTAGHARILAADNGGQICGLRDNGASWLGPFPPVTGERSLPVDVARAALAGAKSYEAETAINATVGAEGLRASCFTMTGVTNPSKQPLIRTRQVLAAMAKHIIGLLQYAAAWIITALTTTRA